MSRPDYSLWAGIPYRVDGRSRSGADCYGLALLCAREEFGVALPDMLVAAISPEAVAGAGDFVGWRPIAKPDWRACDIAVFPAGDALHCALLLDCRRILNTSVMSVSHIADLTAQPYRSSLQGVYRWSMP